MFPTQCIQAYYLDQGSKTADATCEQCFASGENVTKYNATSTRVITSPSESITVLANRCLWEDGEVRTVGS